MSSLDELLQVLQGIERQLEEAGAHLGTCQGKLDEAAYSRDPVFGLEVPGAVPGVPGELLIPRSTWADAAAYDGQAARLAAMFAKNFNAYAAHVPAAVAAAGPR